MPSLTEKAQLEKSTDFGNTHIWSQTTMNHEQLVNLTKTHSPNAPNWAQECSFHQVTVRVWDITTWNHPDQRLAHRRQDTAGNLSRK